MSTHADYYVVLTTTADEEQAETLAKKIVASKLGACVQVQQIKSFYMWKGEACVEPECLLFIKANHTYETP